MKRVVIIDVPDSDGVPAADVPVPVTIGLFRFTGTLLSGEVSSAVEDALSYYRLCDYGRGGTGEYGDEEVAERIAVETAIEALA